MKLSESTKSEEGLLLVLLTFPVLPVPPPPLPLPLEITPPMAFSFSRADLEAFMAFFRGPYTVSACGEAPAGEDWMKFGVDFEVC